jgi:type IV pilus assembly protein PilX
VVNAMKSMRSLPVVARSQRGAVLFVTLILLLVVTLLGVGAVQQSSTGLKRSVESAQKAISFQTAESARVAARRVAEDMAAALGNAPSSFSAAAGQGRYNVGGPGASSAAAPAIRSRAFWANQSNFQAADGLSSYVIEYLGRQELVPDSNRDTGTTVAVHVFRLTIHSTTNSGVETTVQSTYVTNCGGTC